MTSYRYLHGRSRYYARKWYPQCIAVKVEGGFMVFFSRLAWRTWKRQK